MTVPSTDHGTEQVIEEASKLFYAGYPDEALEYLSTNKDNLKCQLSNKHAILIHQLRLSTNAIMLHNWQAEPVIKSLHDTLDNYDLSRQDLASIRDLLGMAKYYIQMNQTDKDFSKAKEDMQIALEIRLKHKEAKPIATSYFHLGLVDQFSDKLEGAREKFTKAQQIAQKSGDEKLLSFTSRHLAFLHVRKEEFDEALSLFKTSLQLRKKLEMKIYLPYSYQSLGDCHKNLDNAVDALRSYESGLLIADELGLNRAQALLHLSIAIFHQSSGAEQNAISHYKKARNYGSEINHIDLIQYVETQLESISD